MSGSSLPDVVEQPSEVVAPGSLRGQLRSIRGSQHDDDGVVVADPDARQRGKRGRRRHLGVDDDIDVDSSGRAYRQDSPEVPRDSEVMGEDTFADRPSASDQ